MLGGIFVLVAEWAASVENVLKFIDACANKKYISQAAYLATVKIAYAAELMETAFEEMLADYLSKNQVCQSANSTLSDNDIWENVENLLLELTELDWVADPDEIQKIQEINLGDSPAQGRFRTILPAFDVYSTAASKLFQKLKPSDRSLNALFTLVQSRAVLSRSVISLKLG